MALGLQLRVQLEQGLHSGGGGAVRQHSIALGRQLSFEKQPAAARCLAEQAIDFFLLK